MTALINTALKPNHVRHNAKLIKFSNYEMPVWYTDIKSEHLAVRNAAGIFDVSHMGLIEISGKDRFKYLNQLICSDLEKCLPGKVMYTMILNPNGGILDDVMIINQDDTFLMIVNCSNKAKIIDWLTTHKTKNITLTDRNISHSLIALQGPFTEELLTTLDISVSDIKKMTAKSIAINGNNALVMRSGYTGEDGFEIMIQSVGVNQLWDDCIQNGATPCGLGARDTLRLEAGLPLYGQELNESITPLSTRYAKWLICWEKSFIGKAALEKLQKETYPVLIGLTFDSPKTIPRYGYTLKEGGFITSGTLSPSLKIPIAMALVDAQKATQTQWHVLIRNNEVSATQVALPFL